MTAARIPDNEDRRLESLARYHIVDTLAEQAYDDIAQIASQICGTNIALVSFVDEKRQWFKAKVGIDLSETPRDIAFCAHAILDPENLMLVRDAPEDVRFADNPFVNSAPYIRFYAGAPLVASDGAALGTLCVIDYQPRVLSDMQLDMLRALSRQVVAQLELRRALFELNQHVRERAAYEERLEAYQRKLESINALLEADSQTDKLTGLSNRRHFDEVLTEEFDRAKKRGRPLSLLLLDIDRFKALNDSFGHSVGDEALKHVSRLLEENKRLPDFVARYGGEEFAVILPGTDEEGAEILAERIRKGIQNASWSHRPVTVSIGVCTYRVSDHSPMQLVSTADEALYRAKSGGRNRVERCHLD
ncbi:MAG: sensor domain-containing diguanylate cyclase [Fimbriimonas sp.]|nr:sensor domain-containing diguanylate cyclase [Fimbriimonas sp.]